MLHSRRKAEIEILSSCDSHAHASHTSQDLQSKTFLGGTMQGADLRRQKNGLLEYVVTKIKKAVDDGVTKHR
jgi:hypothetical protein